MLPTSGRVFISANDRDKPFIAELAKRFVELGFSLVATHGTAKLIEDAGLQVERVYKVKEGRPNVVDLIKGERIQLVDQYAARPRAVVRREGDSPRSGNGAHPDHHDAVGRTAACEGIAALQRGDVKVYALQQLHAERATAAK